MAERIVCLPACGLCGDSGSMAYDNGPDEPSSEDLCRNASLTGLECATPMGDGQPCGGMVYACNWPIEPGTATLGLCGDSGEHHAWAIAWPASERGPGLAPESDLGHFTPAIEAAAEKALATLSHIQTTCGGPHWHAPSAAAMCRDAMRALEAALPRKAGG